MEMLQKTGISGSTLKLIAAVAMLIDHAGVILFDNRREMRMIGRIAFPIFLFLLVEGFRYTRNRKKYILRLFFFSLLSEIPFNLMVTGEPWDLEFFHQNVLFTLLIAFVTLWALESLEKSAETQSVYYVCAMAVVFVGMYTAQVCRTDYASYGVLAAVVMYVLRGNRTIAILSGCLVLGSMGGLEWYCFLSVIPLLLYNGKRGFSFRYFFYVFYPLHLLVLYLLTKIG